MAQCPKCHAQVEIGPQFFGGLFTCPHCQAVYFTSFDGVPEGAIGDQPETDQNLESVTDPAVDMNPMPTVEPMLVPESNNFPQVQPGVQSFDTTPIQEFKNDFPPLDKTPAETIPQTPANALQEIVNFGNQEASASPLMFNLKIKGLDLMQSVSDLQDVLTDAKLDLRFEELKRRIKGGVLVIEKIEPAKAAVIAQRLRTLPVEMEWEQKIYE